MAVDPNNAEAHRNLGLAYASSGRVLDAATTPFWRAFLTAAYAAGLRRMEVAGLRAQDIDSQAGLLRIACGKGGKPREVMLDPELAIMLEKFAADRDLSRAGAARFLMRAALKIPKSDRDAIWREVRSECVGLFRERIERAIQSIPEVDQKKR